MSIPNILLPACLAIALFIVLGTTVSAQVPAAAGTKDLSSSLDSFAQSQVAKGFSGAVLVINGDRTLLEKEYGLQPSKTKTAFWIGSNTKQFTAAAVLRLQEQGKLSVRDPITKFFKDVPPDKQMITVHQLLCHTSGLPHMYVTDGVVDRGAAAKAILSLSLKAKPGDAYSYSNDGYVLLAMIIEIASGKSYENYLRSAVLRPAGMKYTGFWGDAPVVSLAPVPAKLNPRPNRFVDGRTIANWGDRGSTGLYSTIDDQYKWLTALRRGKVLSSSSLEQMWSAQAFVRHGSKPGQDINYGYGWAVVTQDGKRYVVNHAGDEDWLAHNAVISFYENSRNAYIVLSNAGEPNGRSWSSIMSEGLRALIPGQ